MRMLLSVVALAAAAGFARAEDFGDRSQTVTAALEATLKKKAADITAADLATVTTLSLPHIHLPAFKDGDFAGLTGLKSLRFYSLFHRLKAKENNDPPPIGSKVFANLSSLEELIIKDDQLGSRLPDDVFAGLTSLKRLELTNVFLPRLPKSMLSFPKIEAVYYDGKGMDPADYETLRKALGDKLKTLKTSR